MWYENAGNKYEAAYYMHSKEYLEGWNDGFLDADAAASNDDGTYGNGCLYYYNENGTVTK